MLRLGLLLLIIPAVLLMVLFMNEQNQVRECLSAEGVWNYLEARCEPEGTFPFISFLERNPLLVNGGMLASVLGLFMTVIGLYRPSARKGRQE